MTAQGYRVEMTPQAAVVIPITLVMLGKKIQSLASLNFITTTNWLKQLHVNSKPSEVGHWGYPKNHYIFSQTQL